MASDVDDVVSKKPKQSQKAPSEPPPKRTVGGSSQQPKQTSTKSTSQPYQAPAQPSGGSSGGKWLLGIAVVIGLIWLANQSDNSRPSNSAYSPGTSLPSTAPANKPAIAQPQAPNRPSESKPSVGRNNVLSTAQIRYCLAEKIRLDAAETVLNNYNDSDVDRFNGYVSDYNSRCGEFRYRQGSLESARRDVEPYRSQLQAEGRSRFVQSAATTARPSSSTSVPKLARPAPDETVLAIQRRLNELGYNAGTPDGLFGNKTRAAILSFQRESGIDLDGVANTELLREIESAVRQLVNRDSSPTLMPSEKDVQQFEAPANSFVSGSNWYCKDGYRKVGNSCERVKAPANSFVSGSNWYCKDGYSKVGNSCERVEAPANSFVSGSNWYCKDGYKKVGNSCERVEAPANSFVSGSNWYCKDGYRKVGNSCERVKAPANSFVSGSNWYCKDGYKKVGERCVSVFSP